MGHYAMKRHTLLVIKVCQIISVMRYMAFGISTLVTLKPS